MDDNYYNGGSGAVKTGGPSDLPQNDTIGIIGLITGVLSMFLVFCCYPVGLLLGIIAIICGFVAKSKNQRFAVTSRVLGLVAIGLWLLVTLMGLISINCIDTNKWQNFISNLFTYKKID